MSMSAIGEYIDIETLKPRHLVGTKLYGRRVDMKESKPHVRMNFINALNYALRNNCKLRIIKECFKTNNPRDYEFLTPHEVLYKLSNSDEEDIIALINGIWEIDGLYYHKGRMVTEQELMGDDNS